MKEKFMPEQKKSGGERKPVRRLLRHRKTREYFKGDGWTNNPDEAQAYHDVVEAAEICARHDLSQVELTLRFHGETTEVFCTPMR